MIYNLYGQAILQGQKISLKPPAPILFEPCQDPTMGWKHLFPTSFSHHLGCTPSSSFCPLLFVPPLWTPTSNGSTFKCIFGGGGGGGGQHARAQNSLSTAHDERGRGVEMGPLLAIDVRHCTRGGLWPSKRFRDHVHLLRLPFEVGGWALSEKMLPKRALWRGFQQNLGRVRRRELVMQSSK